MQVLSRRVPGPQGELDYQVQQDPSDAHTWPSEFSRALRKGERVVGSDMGAEGVDTLGPLAWPLPNALACVNRAKEWPLQDVESSRLLVGIRADRMALPHQTGSDAQPDAAMLWPHRMRSRLRRQARGAAGSRTITLPGCGRRTCTCAWQARTGTSDTTSCQIAMPCIRECVARRTGGWKKDRRAQRY